jgi:hypothetical protein
LNVQDVSVDTEISYKLFNRMMLVRQTLSIMSVQIWHYVEVDNSQGTEAENEYKTNLLSLRELQLSQEGHWDSEDHDISSDIQRSIGEPEGEFVHAMARDACVPERVHRDAHEYGSEDGPAAIDDQNAYHDAAQLGDLFCSEDAHVLKDNRNLGQHEGEIVILHGDGGPDSLWRKEQSVLL